MSNEQALHSVISFTPILPNWKLTEGPKAGNRPRKLKGWDLNPHHPTPNVMGIFLHHVTFFFARLSPRTWTTHKSRWGPRTGQRIPSAICPGSPDDPASPRGHHLSDGEDERGIWLGGWTGKPDSRNWERLQFHKGNGETREQIWRFHVHTLIFFC